MSLNIADCWFERRKIDVEITLQGVSHFIPLIWCKIWYVRSWDCDLFIDTGLGSLCDTAVDLIDNPDVACAVHPHGDHIGGHHEFEVCLVHCLEDNDLRSSSPSNSFYLDDLTFATCLNRVGYLGHLDQCMITVLPHAGYDPGAYLLKGPG